MEHSHKHSGPDTEIEDLKIDHTGILYKVLNVKPDATTQQIRKSYKVLARKLHPDKNQEDPEAKEKFQKLSEAYKILSDENKRRVYDRTGELDEDSVTDIQKFVEAYIYYREKYKEVTEEDIIKYKSKYVGSDEEAEDLLDFFELNQGDVTLILEAIPYSSNDDIDRFNDFFLTRLPDFPPEYAVTFRITCKNIKPYSQELTKEEADKEISNLAHLIQNKN